MKCDGANLNLGEYLERKKDFDYWAAKVAEMEPLELYKSPAAGAGGSGGSVGSAVESAVIELEMARGKKQDAEEKMRAAMNRVLGIIDKAPTADQRWVMRRRYIDGMDWDEMAAEKGKSRAWVTNQHGTALSFMV